MLILLSDPIRLVMLHLKSLIYETSVDSIEAHRQRDNQSCRQIRMVEQVRQPMMHSRVYWNWTWSPRTISLKADKQLLQHKIICYSKTKS